MATTVDPIAPALAAWSAALGRAHTLGAVAHAYVAHERALAALGPGALAGARRDARTRAALVLRAMRAPVPSAPTAVGLVLARAVAHARTNVTTAVLATRRPRRADGAP